MSLLQLKLLHLIELKIFYTKRHAKYRRILTGSPVTKSPLDLYSQCEFLRSMVIRSSSYMTFRARYAIVKKLSSR